jgi:hypothetical protein
MNGALSGCTCFKFAPEKEIEMMSRWRRAVASPILWKTVLGLVCFIFVTSVILGYVLGKQMSPPYTDATLGPRYLTEFMATVAGAELATPVVQRDVDGRIISVERPVRRLIFVCDPVVYVLDAGTRKVTESTITPEVTRYANWMRAVRKPAPSLDVALGALFGASGAAAFNVRSATSKFSTAWNGASRLQQAQLLAWAAVGLGSGFAFGYWWSYEPYPRCGESSIKALLKDSPLWERLWSDIHSNNESKSSWSFRWAEHPKSHLAAVLHADQLLFPKSSLEELPELSMRKPRSYPEETPTFASASAPGRGELRSFSYPLDSSGALRSWLTCDIIKAGDADLAWTVFAWTTPPMHAGTEASERAAFDSMSKDCGDAHSEWRQPSEMREAWARYRGPVETAFKKE